MKLTRLVFVLFATGVVALAGCSRVQTDGTLIRQDTPKGTLETIAIAMDRNDLGTVADVTEPAYRKPMKVMDAALRDSVSALENLAKVVEGKFGKDDAKVVRDAITRQSGGKNKDRTVKLLTNGTLDESKFDMKVDGDKATVTIKDDPGQPMILIKIDGKWCSQGPAGVTPEAAQKAADQMSTIINRETRKIEALTRDVKDGTLAKDKFAGEFAKIQVGF
ncbi:MAG: hypothetical protein WCI73_09000 [Phycisphaerae bacterium]